MQQLSFLDRSLYEVVNVAQVKHRSPFRYPGGKTWLVPHVVQWLMFREEPVANFIEPFAGGAIVGLSVAFEHLADHVTLVELDSQVAAVWETVINAGEGEWLARRIEQFNFTAETVNEVLKQTDLTIRERAFQTILQNRTAHGGILAKGAGLIKFGENGKGLASRWYPTTLAKRVRDIDKIRNRLTFICGDAFEVIEANRDRDDAVFFVDPPYTAGKNGKRAGKRLYTHYDIDHERLFSLLGKAHGDFLITYDNDEYVRELAAHHGLKYEEIVMQNTHLTKMTELVIRKKR